MNKIVWTLIKSYRNQWKGSCWDKMVINKILVNFMWESIKKQGGKIFMHQKIIGHNIICIRSKNSERYIRIPIPIICLPDTTLVNTISIISNFKKVFRKCILTVQDNTWYTMWNQLVMLYIQSKLLHQILRYTFHILIYPLAGFFCHSCYNKYSVVCMN